MASGRPPQRVPAVRGRSHRRNARPDGWTLFRVGTRPTKIAGLFRVRLPRSQCSTSVNEGFFLFLYFMFNF